MLASDSQARGLSPLRVDDTNSYTNPGAFGPFRVMHQIGVGVLGPVFRTYDPANDRLIAVKVFHLDITPEQVQSLVQELRPLIESGLSNHPAIVAPIAIGVEEDVPYLAQEYVTAESLDVAMRHYAPASIETALPFIKSLAEAIDAAHQLGIVHGGLHLRDIFVSQEESRSTGFGVVKALESVGLKGPIRRPYTSPEIITGRAWGGKADLFALAAITYEILTGKRAAGTGEQLTQRLAEIEGIADQDRLQAVFSTALADDPEVRYSSAVGFVSALRAVLINDSLNQDEPEAADLLTAFNHHRESDSEVLDESPVLRSEMQSINENDNDEDELDCQVKDAGSMELIDQYLDDNVSKIDVEIKENEPREGSEFAEDSANIAESYDSVKFDDGDPVLGGLYKQEGLEHVSSIDDQTEEPSMVSVEEVAPVTQSLKRSRVRSARIGLSLLAVAALAAATVHFFGFWFGGSDEVNDPESEVSDEIMPSANDFSDETISNSETMPAVGTSALPETSVASVMSEVSPFINSALTLESSPAIDLENQEENQESLTALDTVIEDVQTGFGWILIRTVPPSSLVLLDGLSLGRTPLSLGDVPFGKHRVVVSHTGYNPEMHEVLLSRDARVASLDIELVQVGASSETDSSSRVGSLQVDSRPAGARIIMDGRVVGITPIVLPDVVSGIHLIRIEREGYQAWVTAIDVQASDRVRVAASLERALTP